MVKKKKIIFQASPQHTGSTLFINMLYGIFEDLYTKKIIGMWDKDFINCFKNNELIILKCHNTNIDELIEQYSKIFDVYFCCTERKEYKYMIEKKYKSYKNVIVFEYNNLIETSKNKLENIVDNVYEKLNMFLKDNCIKYNTLLGVQRVRDMNKRYIDMKKENREFGYIDPFYEIHGNHRNRKHTTEKQKEKSKK
jgi:hypothetical protein